LVWVLLALCLLCYFFIAGDFGLYQMWHQGREKKALQREIEALRRENAELEARILRLKNDLDYIEKLAREEYGMVKKGETLYRIQPQPQK